MNDKPFGRRFSETLTLEPGGTVRSTPGAPLWPVLLLAIPAGTQILRFLPALNLREAEAKEGLEILESVVAKVG